MHWTVEMGVHLCTNKASLLQMLITSCTFNFPEVILSNMLSKSVSDSLAIPMQIPVFLVPSVVFNVVLACIVMLNLIWRLLCAAAVREVCSV